MKWFTLKLYCERCKENTIQSKLQSFHSVTIGSKGSEAGSTDVYECSICRTINLKKEKNFIQCPACKANNKTSNNFCIKCGTKLLRKVVEDLSSIIDFTDDQISKELTFPGKGQIPAKFQEFAKILHTSDNRASIKQIFSEFNVENYENRIVDGNKNSPKKRSKAASLLESGTKCLDIEPVSLPTLAAALVYFDDCLKLTPNDERAWLKKGMTLVELRRFDDAIECYDMVLNIEPNSWEGWMWRGRALSDKKNYQEAINNLNLSIALNPLSGFAWLSKGFATMNITSDLEVGIQCFKNAVELNPKLISAWLNLGLMYLQAGKLEEAINSYDTVLAIDPLHKVSLIQKGSILARQKKYEEALKVINLTLSKYPNSPIAWNNKGATYIELRMYDEAEHCFDMALKSDPTNFKAMENKERLKFLRMGFSL